MNQLDLEKLSPDILINAAGIREITPVLHLSDDMFKKYHRINVKQVLSLEYQLHLLIYQEKAFLNLIE
jgi:short-subunit dehydrogenase